MKIGRLLIAAILLGGMGAAVWWSNRSEAAKANKPAPDASPKILSLTEADITGIEIKHGDGDPVVLKKDNSGKWAITAPKPLPADQSAVAQVTSTASNLSSDRVVDTNVTDPAQYGLSPAAVRATFTLKNGKKSTVLLGVDTPTGNGVYAKLDGDPRLFTTSSYNKTQLDKGAKDLRDKRLMTFDQDKTSRVELTAKHQTIEFGRIAQNEWQILKPKPMRADGFQVEDLVRKIGGANMDTTVSDEDLKKAESAFASGTPIALAKVTDPNGMQTLEVRQYKDDYYAKSSVVEGVHKVAKDVGEGLDKSLDDFRNKKLFDFGFNDPNNIEIKDKDSGKDLQLTKAGDKWMSGGKNMDSTSVQALIDKLRDFSASKFVDSGFKSPVLEITVVSNDGKRTEKVQTSLDGADFVARRDGDPSTLYYIDASAVHDLRQAASEVMEQPTAPPHK